IAKTAGRPRRGNVASSIWRSSRTDRGGTSPEPLRDDRDGVAKRFDDGRAFEETTAGRTRAARADKDSWRDSACGAQTRGCAGARGERTAGQDISGVDLHRGGRARKERRSHRRETCKTA